MRTPRSFDEATVRLKSATIQDGVYDPKAVLQDGKETHKRVALITKSTY